MFTWTAIGAKQINILRHSVTTCSRINYTLHHKYAQMIVISSMMPEMISCISQIPYQGREQRGYQGAGEFCIQPWKSSAIPVSCQPLPHFYSTLHEVVIAFYVGLINNLNMPQTAPFDILTSFFLFVAWE